jgi:hypothetical protein
MEENEEELNNAPIAAQFALVRYFISEQTHRDHMNLSLKAFDAKKMAPSYESELTLDKVENVLYNMGFKDTLPQRKKDMIQRIAVMLAHYRAVFEVTAVCGGLFLWNYLRQSRLFRTTTTIWWRERLDSCHC